jgi:hypothetical protein
MEQILEGPLLAELCLITTVWLDAELVMFRSWSGISFLAHFSG